MNNASRLFPPLVAFALLFAGPAYADALKDQAVARVAASHDPEIFVAIGCVYVKQAGLKAIRSTLAARGRAAGLDTDWNESAPEWQAAEVQLTAIVDREIANRVEQPGWLRDAWQRQAARVLDAEEADAIATHFASEGGREQRIVIELLLVGETVLANYTFTDRIDYRIKGSEKEMARLQRIWWAREPFRVRDFTPYPGAMRFALQDPGVKYTKMLAIQGVEAITGYLDRVAKDTGHEVVQAAGVADLFISAYRRRSAGGE